MDFDKLISKEFDDIVDLSKVDTRVKTWFDTGVYALNYICSKNLKGGIPAGRVTSIDGLAATGKSLLVASIMKDPKIDYILLIETEGGGAGAELLQFVGVDMSKVRMIKAHTFENYRIDKKNSSIEEVPDNKFPAKKETDKYIYVEGVTRIVKKVINAITFNKINKNILIVLDSLGNIQSTRELQGVSDMGYKSQKIAAFFRTFDIAFEKTNVAFVFTNKLYTNLQNPWDPYVASGGVNVEFNPSLSIRLSTVSESDDISSADLKEEKDRRKSALGSSLKTIKATIKKSRFGTEMRNIRFLIDFSTGPVKYSGLFTLCNDFGLLKRKGSYYTFEGVFDKPFYKKDFISLVKENEEEVIDKIQKKLEQVEQTFKEKVTEVNDLNDLEIEKDEEQMETLKQMERDLDE